jgi:hypothetical protein
VRILIDESLPRYVRRMLKGYQVATVQEMGCGGLKNGPLLARMEGQFDVFLTGDKNLQYQQNLSGRQVAIVVFPSNRLSVVKGLEAPLKAALANITAGALVELEFP